MFEVVYVENYPVYHFLFCPNTGLCDQRVLSQIAEKLVKTSVLSCFKQLVSYCIKLVALKQFFQWGGAPESQQF